MPSGLKGNDCILAPSKNFHGVVVCDFSLVAVENFMRTNSLYFGRSSFYEHLGYY